MLDQFVGLDLSDRPYLIKAREYLYQLVDHLTAGVDWVAAVEHMTADGVTTFIEVGPGKVLTNLIKRIAPDATAIALDDVLAGADLDLPVLQPSEPATLN